MVTGIHEYAILAMSHAYGFVHGIIDTIVFLAHPSVYAVLLFYILFAAIG